MEEFLHLDEDDLKRNFYKLDAFVALEHRACLPSGTGTLHTCFVDAARCGSLYTPNQVTNAGIPSAWGFLNELWENGKDRTRSVEACL